MTDKMPAVIFDLDGTLADLNGRKPYGKEQTQCLDDLCIETIAELFRLYDKCTDYMLIIVSGREDTVRNQTLDWLVKHDLTPDLLFMRAAKDYRPDTEVKAEIYREKIEPHFEVCLVVDDRPSVWRMWKSLGLFTLFVGPAMEF